MRLKDLRKAKGLTQSEIANSLSVPLNTYRNWERGERQVPADVLFALADFYDVSLDYLMGRDITPSDARKAQLNALYDMLNQEGKGMLLLLARMLVKSGDYLAI